MKYNIKFTVLALLFVGLFLTIGCSEIKDDITQPAEFTHHPEGFGDAASPNFHKFAFVNSNWSFNLTKCQSCHAADYAGGTVGVSCLTCHTQPAGPEACNTCHGEFANPNFISPPNDLEGNSDKGSKGVGAHFIHVYNNGKSTNIGCFECHQQTLSDDAFVHAHISPTPAKMQFGEFTYADSLGVDPEYSFTNLDCSNTYCHGGFKFSKSSSTSQWAYSGDYIVGNNYSPVWNSTTGLEAQCGTCHGQIIGGELTPLPIGHFGSFKKTDCANCHSSMVNSNGEIIDKFKHINKEKNL
jgi:predicted CxxxxCH...CXXCH cytochrome family protein